MSVCPLESSPEAAFLFIRKGNLTVNGGGSFDFNHTFIYEAGGHLNAGGGGTLNLTPNQGDAVALPPPSAIFDGAPLSGPAVMGALVG